MEIPILNEGSFLWFYMSISYHLRQIFTVLAVYFLYYSLRILAYINKSYLFKNTTCD